MFVGNCNCSKRFYAESRKINHLLLNRKNHDAPSPFLHTEHDPPSPFLHTKQLRMIFSVDFAHAKCDRVYDPTQLN